MDDAAVSNLCEQCEAVLLARLESGDLAHGEALDEATQHVAFYKQIADSRAESESRLLNQVESLQAEVERLRSAP